jgi:hypothetical protein
LIPYLNSLAGLRNKKINSNRSWPHISIVYRSYIRNPILLESLSPIRFVSYTDLPHRERCCRVRGRMRASVPVHFSKQNWTASCIQTVVPPTLSIKPLVSKRSKQILGLLKRICPLKQYVSYMSSARIKNTTTLMQVYPTGIGVKTEEKNPS